jgi:flagellar basal body-associated protein FliL
MTEISLDGSASAGPDGETVPDLEVRTSISLRVRNLLLGLRNRFVRPDVPFRWNFLLSWKALVPAGVVVALLASGSLTYVHLRQKEESQKAAQKAKQAVAAVLPVVQEAVFSDFSIDIKDARGQYRFLQCDITLEFQSGLEMTEDRKADIRRVIYQAAQKKGTELIRISDSGSRLKKEMRDDLRNLLGEGALKEIYITKYVFI